MTTEILFHGKIIQVEYSDRQITAIHGVTEALSEKDRQSIAILCECAVKQISVMEATGDFIWGTTAS